MKTLLSSFKASLPRDVVTLVEKLNSKGINVGFIGGVVRDFILHDTISNDIDIEIRSKDPIDMNKLALELDAKLNKEFEILTLDFEGHSLEIGQPRIENFNDGEMSHKNFTFSYSQDYLETFRRRDFTINAIMIEFNLNGISLIDPLLGLSDIENKILKPCSLSFKFDPVRKLRAYRFRINTSFDFDESLHSVLKEMNTSDCSNFYIQKEASKSKKPLSFLKAVGVIENFQKVSIYDCDQYKLKTILEREPSLRSKEVIFNRLNLGVKKILPYKNINSFEDCYQMFKYFFRYQVSITEIKYILTYAGLDLRSYNFDSFYDCDIKFNSIGMDEDQKRSKFLDLLIEQVKL